MNRLTTYSLIGISCFFLGIYIVNCNVEKKAEQGIEAYIEKEEKKERIRTLGVGIDTLYNSKEDLN